MIKDFDFKCCRLCPRGCGSNRTVSSGFCGVGDKLKIARAALHFGEEPCISGESGSGTIFFSGCPLHCVFCQNGNISRECFGAEITSDRLVQICFELKAKGAANINLVTPMHFAPLIRKSLLSVKKELAIPIVVNTGGYDSVETLKYFEGLAGIYLPDFKYASNDTAKKYSQAPNYPEIASAAVKEMLSQTGRPVFDDKGMLKSGVVIRLLVLPGERKDCISVLNIISGLFDPEDIVLSIMSQYTPQKEATGNLARKITEFEYQSVVDEALRLGFSGYMQKRSSASSEYTPDFDLTGVFSAGNA